MNVETVRRLNGINRTFYEGCADAFDASRSEPWPGWERLPELLRARGAGGLLRVLDVGCGNGRFAAFLGERWPGPFEYVGVDASAPLIERARSRDLARAAWRLADFVETPASEALPGESFSLVVLFGVLHHVPSAARRRALLRAAAGRLEPGGLLVLTSWRFEAFQRFRDRLLPWDVYNRGAREPIDLAQLEPGDHLLPWGGADDAGTDRPLRYCHFSREEELMRMLEEIRLEPVASFEADGREGRLNRYLVHRRREATA